MIGSTPILIWWLTSWTGVIQADGQSNAPASPARSPVVVRSKIFPIHYSVSTDALPLTRVELWYTVDDEGVWHRFGEDADRRSPIEFAAAEEGVYGLFIVVTNRAGASSPPPDSRTVPHQRVFVDYTPPVVHLPPPRVSMTADGPVIQIRWTALDANWGSRPIEIAYRPADGGDWTSVCRERLSNSGQYDWPLPAELSGPFVLRVAAWDRAGNRAEAISAPLDSSAITAEPAGLTGPTRMPETDARAMPRSSNLIADGRLTEGTTYEQAARRLRELMRYPSPDASAIAEIGGALYALGDRERALEAYRLALERDPGHVSALIGAARIHAEHNEYAPAADLLEALLEHNQADGLGWLALGDVRLKQGDDLAARQCYRKAAGSTNPEVVRQARRRLDDMDALRRRLNERGQASGLKER